MSRTIRSIVAATVDEKDKASKARELFIVSLLLSHFMKYKRIRISSVAACWLESGSPSSSSPDIRV
jgi:hypothetical protein